MTMLSCASIASALHGPCICLHAYEQEGRGVLRSHLECRFLMRKVQASR